MSQPVSRLVAPLRVPLLAILVSLVATVVAAETFVTVGAIPWSEVELEVSGLTLKDDADFGGSIGFDWSRSPVEGVDLGLGAAVTFPRGTDDLEGEYYQVPLFARVGYVLAAPDSWSPFLTVRAGYSWLFGDDDFKSGGSTEGGFYYALGGGLEVPNLPFHLRLETLWEVGNGGVVVGGRTTDFSQDAISVVVGFGFD